MYPKGGRGDSTAEKENGGNQVNNYGCTVGNTLPFLLLFLQHRALLPETAGSLGRGRREERGATSADDE